MGIDGASSGARILVICYANICRSPGAAALLAGRLGTPIEVTSRGVKAFPGAGICPASATWAMTHGGAPTGQHQSRHLELGDIRAATLILTASRRQRSHVVKLRPSAQVRTFTIAQAARIAGWSHDQGARPPQQHDLPERLLWLTQELNDQRAAAPQAGDGADDVPDPHRGGTHAEAFPVISAAVDVLCEALGA